MAIQPEPIGPIDIRAAFKTPTGLACGGVSAGRGRFTPLSYRADSPLRPSPEGIHYWMRGLTLHRYMPKPYDRRQYF